MNVESEEIFISTFLDNAKGNGFPVPTFEIRFGFPTPINSLGISVMNTKVKPFLPSKTDEVNQIRPSKIEKLEYRGIKTVSALCILITFF